jgi:hypothetical protein
MTVVNRRRLISGPNLAAVPSRPEAGIPGADCQGPSGQQKRPFADDVAIAASADVLRIATRRL